MAKQKPTETKQEQSNPRPSQSDLSTLRQALAKFNQFNVDGVWWSSFDQFLEKLGAVANVNGEWVVKNQHEYNHWNKVHSYMQTLDWYELEPRMKESPEEAAAFKEIVKSHRPEFIIKRMPKV